MLRLSKSAIVIFSIAYAATASAKAGPFGVAPLGLSALANVTGSYSPTGFARNAKLVADQNARTTFDATASINRVTFDNWFAREGAELISAGALGRPLELD